MLLKTLAALFALAIGGVATAAVAISKERSRNQAHVLDANWVLLGTRSVDLKTDGDRFDVGASKGRFKSLMIVGVDRRIDIHRVTITTDGEPYVETQRLKLAQGQRSHPIRFNHDGGVVQRVDVAYRSHLGAGGAAKLELWGLRCLSRSSKRPLGIAALGLDRNALGGSGEGGRPHRRWGKQGPFQIPYDRRRRPCDRYQAGDGRDRRRTTHRKVALETAARATLAPHHDQPRGADRAARRSLLPAASWSGWTCQCRAMGNAGFSDTGGRCLATAVEWPTIGGDNADSGHGCRPDVEETDGDGAVLFGVQELGTGADQDVFKLGRQYGKFARLRLRALGAGVQIKELRVIYAGGEPDILTFDAELAADERTAWLDLKGDRFISQLHFVYPSQSRRSKGRLEVYGQYAESWFKPGVGDRCVFGGQRWLALPWRPVALIPEHPTWFGL